MECRVRHDSFTRAFVKEILAASEHLQEASKRLKAPIDAEIARDEWLLYWLCMVTRSVIYNTDEKKKPSIY